MHAIEWILGIILLLCAVFLVVAVLFQQGKQKGLSGSISGGADTFFGKTKGKTIDKILDKATTVIAIIFAVLVVVAFICDGMFDTPAVLPTGDETATTAAPANENEPAGETAAATTAAPAVETTVPAVETTVPAEG
ncbi:MAG: preprotein translocase subunit SecG [Clostridia bacterium]|nr:preprotein translocase subunit SecG [Clostridia bacterium]